MANIISKKTIRKGSKTRIFVIEKFGAEYGVGRYNYGGLTVGWKGFKYLTDARKYFAKLIQHEKESPYPYR